MIDRGYLGTRGLTSEYVKARARATSSRRRWASRRA